MLDKIPILFMLFASGHANAALAAPPLRTIRADVGALDEPIVRESDNHSFVGN